LYFGTGRACITSKGAAYKDKNNVQGIGGDIIDCVRKLDAEEKRKSCG
jgi:hypothetical protein